MDGPPVHVPVGRVALPREGPGDEEVLPGRYVQLHGDGRVFLHPVHHESAQIIGTP